jgi:hypothetical protein
VRLVPLLLVALVAAGCGVSAEESGAPGSSEPMTSGETVPAVKTKGTFDESRTKPPPVILVSRAGKQIAVQGSSCVQYTDPNTGEGGGACADSGPIHPANLTVAQPGEHLDILLAGAYSTGDGIVTITRLGCTGTKIEELDLATGMSGTHADVDLEPGAYELDLFTRFASDDGRQGDLSATLGLLVDPNRAPEIIPARAKFDVCQFPA